MASRRCTTTCLLISLLSVTQLAGAQSIDLITSSCLQIVSFRPLIALLYLAILGITTWMFDFYQMLWLQVSKRDRLLVQATFLYGTFGSNHNGKKRMRMVSFNCCCEYLILVDFSNFASSTYKTNHPSSKFGIPKMDLVAGVILIFVLDFILLTFTLWHNTCKTDTFL